MCFVREVDTENFDWLCFPFSDQHVKFLPGDMTRCLYNLDLLKTIMPPQDRPFLAKSDMKFCLDSYLVRDG